MHVAGGGAKVIAMKRNMVPLLGIAFVVAIISTGVFYGLLAGKLRSKPTELPGHSIVVAGRDLERGTVVKPGDLQVAEVKGALKGSFSRVDDAVGTTLLEAVQQNEPLLEARVALREPKAGGISSGVATGMRAVSIRVAESSGLMGLLHAGSRVDVQAVSERNGLAELRTILQNVEVLRINPQLEMGNNRPPVPVATVLVPAQYADLIALADTGARIRLTLRNPLDEATAPRHSLALTSVFTGVSTSVAQSEQKASAVAPSQDHDIQLYIQVLGASAAALAELESKFASSPENDSLRVAAFRADTDADELVRKLEESKELELVSSSKLSAAVGRPVSLRAAATPYRLRVQFSPAADSLGRVTLRVQPEVSLRHGPGVESHRYDAEVPNGSFLVKGLFQDQTDASVLGRLFPGHAWSGRALVIFVTARTSGQAPHSAVAQTNRGQ
jgi:pilus assembly protein CpaB